MLKIYGTARRILILDSIQLFDDKRKNLKVNFKWKDN